MGATGKSGAKAKGGLVRAMMAHKGWEANAKHWRGAVSRHYRMILLEEGEEKTREVINEQGERVTEVVRKGMKSSEVAAELAQLSRGRNVALSKMLRFKVRYFTDGAVIGSRGFVEEVFQKSRERFGPNRKTGARKLKGSGSAAARLLWSARDLKG
jgi:hypothetical protein